MADTVAAGYHHGDLRATLIATARRRLEAGDALSLRAVAREIGVSAAAPYRHFADREAWESAVAVEGFRELRDLLAPDAAAPSLESITDASIAYVRFALDHPALFRLMFGQECDDANDERVIAAGQLRAVVTDVVGAVFPDREVAALGTALWSLAHGLAFLHLDGKLPARDRRQVDDRVRAAIEAVLPR